MPASPRRRAGDPASSAPQIGLFAPEASALPSTGAPLQPGVPTEPASLAQPLSSLFDAVPPDWRTVTEPFRASALGQTLIDRVEAACRQGATVYPADVFAALRHTRRDQVKVVILGQDPYHGPGQAHGVSFSVPPGVPIPPSLLNIFKEIGRDLGLPMPTHGCLQRWAGQGVLLLNAVLTVEMGKAASHQGRGWEKFTDAVIDLVARQERPIVFILWGAYAQRKAAFVKDVSQGGRHLVIRSAHPSPLSAHNGFLGSRPFSRANAFLEEHGQAPIDWRVPD